MTPYDAASFSAGQETGTRVAACIARLAALQLMDDSRWWNRRRHGFMARALIAHAEEMEGAAEEAGAEPALATPREPISDRTRLPRAAPAALPGRR
jgi:hypothetical protein